MVVRDDAGDAHAATGSMERDERFDDLRVERAGRRRRAIHAERLLHRERGPVGTVARERVEDVCDGDDATLERDLVALQPPRIAAAVPALVMRPRDRRRELEQVAARAAEQVATDLGVLLHQRPLRRR